MPDTEETSAEPSEPDTEGTDTERMMAALAALDDAALRHALGSVGEQSRAEVAAHLQLPPASMHLGDALPPLVRRKLRHASPERASHALFALVAQVNNETVAALGVSSENPTPDELRTVLPAVVERHGAPLVTAMVAGYAASDAPCRAAMRELLETDEQLAIGPPVELAEGGLAIALPAKPADDADTVAKRAQRRAAKEAKRAASARTREANVSAQQKRREALHRAKHRHS